VFLLILFILPMPVFGHSTFFGPNWFLHPDETHDYVLAMMIAFQGRITATSTLDASFEDPVLTPAGFLRINETIVPRRPVGFAFLISWSLYVAPQCPFLLVAILACASALFVYLLAERMLKNSYSAFVAWVFYTVSVPQVYWANMLFANIPAFAFFTAGVLGLLPLYEQPSVGGRRIVLSGVLLAMAVWLRVEYVVFIGVIALMTLLRSHTRSRMVAYVLITVAIVVSPMLAVNSYLYGSPFLTGYTVTGSSSPGSSGGDLIDMMIEGAALVFQRFMTQEVQPNWYRLTSNTWFYVVCTVPIQTVLAPIGLWQSKKMKRGPRWLLIALVVVCTWWAYDTLGGWHWGEGKPWVGSVYLRYLVPTYGIIAILAGDGFRWLVEEASRRVVPLIGTLGSVEDYRARPVQIVAAVLLLVVLVPTVAVPLAEGEVGLVWTEEWKREGFSLNQFVDGLPENAIIVSGFYGKIIISRPVLDYMRIDPSRGDRREITVQYIFRLLDDGYDIYLLEAPWHSGTYRNVAGYIEYHYPQLVLQRIVIPYDCRDADNFYHVVRNI